MVFVVVYKKLKLFVAYKKLNLLSKISESERGKQFQANGTRKQAGVTNLNI